MAQLSKVTVVSMAATLCAAMAWPEMVKLQSGLSMKVVWQRYKLPSMGTVMLCCVEMTVAGSDWRNQR